MTFKDFGRFNIVCIDHLSFMTKCIMISVVLFYFSVSNTMTMWLFCSFDEIVQIASTFYIHCSNVLVYLTAMYDISQIHFAMCFYIYISQIHFERCIYIYIYISQIHFERCIFIYISQIHFERCIYIYISQIHFERCIFIYISQIRFERCIFLYFTNTLWAVHFIYIS